MTQAPVSNADPRLGRLLWKWMPVLFCWGILLFAFARIRTFVTGQDPFWYIALARQFLEGRTIASELAPGLAYVAPGFPLLLALSISLFGPFAPYGVNVVFGAVFIAALHFLCRRVFESGSASVLILLTTLVVILTGYALNAHFLLYPFRGMPIYALMFLGYLLVCSTADARVGAVRLLASGTCFLAAIGIREPAVFGCAGAALWIVWHGGFRRRYTWIKLVWFGLPFAIALAAVGIASAILDRATTNQLQSWSAILAEKELEVLVADFTHTAYEMETYLIEALTWPGLLVLGVGVWSIRRNKAAICFFAVPALLYYLFYSLYIPHYRYFLTVLVFLCPVVGSGLVAMVEGAGLLLRRVWRRGPEALRAGAMVAIAALLVAAASNLRPWGVAVGRSEVRQFLTSVDEVVPKDARVFLEHSSRYLGDAFLSYGALTHPSLEEVPHLIEAGAPCYFFEPLNEEAHFPSFLSGRMKPRGIRTERVLRHYGELEPAPAEIHIAGGRFSVLRLVPWASNRSETRVPVVRGRDTVFWLSCRGSGDGVTATVSIRDPSGSPVYEQADCMLRGITGFAVSGSRMATSWVKLRVDADRPIPSDVFIGTQRGKDAMKFPLGRDRLLGTQQWFRPPFAPTGVRDSFAAVLDGSGGVLRVPVPRGDGFREIEVLLTMDSVGVGDGTATVTYVHDGRLLASYETDLSRPTTYHSFRVPRPAGDPDVEITVRMEGDAAGRHVLRPRQTEFWARDWDE